ncbi:unnamed protein product [Effrenium voratum]|nr:unnamed protein product [Effrenium voratum]
MPPLPAPAYEATAATEEPELQLRDRKGDKRKGLASGPALLPRPARELRAALCWRRSDGRRRRISCRGPGRRSWAAPPGTWCRCSQICRSPVRRTRRALATTPKWEESDLSPATPSGRAQQGPRRRAKWALAPTQCTDQNT